MTTPELGNVPIEDDPTGMRALLSSLPDPGGMPDDLAARILASIEREQRHLEAGGIWDPEPAPSVPAIHAAPADAAASASGEHARVVPIRRRPRWAPLIGVAAGLAVLGFGGGAVVKLISGGLGGSAASGNAYSSEAARPHSTHDDVVGQQPSSASSPGSDATATGSEAIPPEGFRFRESQRSFSAASLASDAQALLADGLSTTNSARSTLSAPAAAQECAIAVAGAEAQILAVDIGTFEAAPAALIVLATPRQQQAYVVTPGCSSANDRVLAGPVTIP